MKMMYLILNLSACSFIIAEGQPGAMRNSLKVSESISMVTHLIIYLTAKGMGEWQAKLINMYLLDPKMSQHFIVLE